MEIEDIVHSLSFAAAYLQGDNPNSKHAKTLLQLKDKVLEGTPTVWSNRKAFRRYQGQGEYMQPKKGYEKYKVIMIEDE